MWEFTPFEWGLLGFAGLMFLVGIYYTIEDKRRKRGKKD